MRFIQGKDRSQIELFCLDEIVSADSYARLVDLFVNSLELGEYGFKVDFIENGRPAYHPSTLLKLYIYGYLNRIRSSRSLEQECKRNLELMWLMCSLRPDHNTIANFRKNNPKAIKNVFRASVNLAKNLDLIGGVLLAGDGTKLRGQNSKKNNFNQKKIDRHIKYIDSKIEEYLLALETSDGDVKETIQSKIDKQVKHKEQYKAIEKQLNETGESQVSSSDPEARQLIIRGTITEVCYNVQSTVDAKFKIPIDYQVTNQNDKQAMAAMVENAIEVVGNNSFDAVFDKGYYTAEQIHKVQELGVCTHVCVPNPASNAPDIAYNLSEFEYCKQDDTYLCPAGNTLTSNGNWYDKRAYRVKQYKTPACKNCPVKSSCTKSKSQRIIERHEFAEALEINKQNIENRPEIYAQRQAIVEHPFGTMKRGWGFDYIMTKKGISRASADVGFIFIAYNLKRIINILGFSKLRDVLVSILNSFLSSIWRFLAILSISIKELKPFAVLYNTQVQFLELTFFNAIFENYLFLT
jgi:transposase